MSLIPWLLRPMRVPPLSEWRKKIVLAEWNELLSSENAEQAEQCNQRRGGRAHANQVVDDTDQNAGT